MFSASDYQRAQEPWQIELDGTAFTARLVSQQAVFAYWARVEDAQRTLTGAKNQEVASAVLMRVIVRALRRLLREAFPWRPSMLVHGDPVRRIFRLDPATFWEAIRDFFESLARHAPAELQAAIRTSAPALH